MVHSGIAYIEQPKYQKKDSIMDNNLQKYIAFVKTVETGSFTRAAETLSYSQSSVSKMIADLEKEWNVTLLERDRNGVHLTGSGEQILPYARQLISDYQKLEEHVHLLNGIQTGVIRIGTFASPAINWLPNIVAEFQKDFPMVECEMLLGDYGEVENWIRDGRVDCGFLSLPSQGNGQNPSFSSSATDNDLSEYDLSEDGLPQDNLTPISANASCSLELTFHLYKTLGLYAASLKMDEYMVILPVGHPLSQKQVIDPHDLDDQPFLLLEHGGKTEVTEILERSHIHPNIRFTTWEDYAIMAMAEKGLGIGILPQMILKRVPYQLEIRPLAVPYYRNIGIAVKDPKKPSPAVKKFFEYLKYRE